MNSVIKQLQSELERKISSRIDFERAITHKTDMWVKTQKQIIDITETLAKLGYTFDYKIDKTRYQNIVVTLHKDE
jgi:hypothetical protein